MPIKTKRTTIIVLFQNCKKNINFVQTELYRYWGVSVLIFFLWAIGDFYQSLLSKLLSSKRPHRLAYLYRSPVSPHAISSGNYGILGVLFTISSLDEISLAVVHFLEPKTYLHIIVQFESGAWNFAYKFWMHVSVSSYTVMDSYRKRKRRPSS